MLKQTTANCHISGVDEWLLDEGIHESQIINIETLGEDTYRIWYRN